VIHAIEHDAAAKRVVDHVVLDKIAAAAGVQVDAQRKGLANRARRRGKDCCGSRCG